MSRTKKCWLCKETYDAIEHVECPGCYNKDLTLTEKGQALYEPIVNRLVKQDRQVREREAGWYCLSVSLTMLRDSGIDPEVAKNKIDKIIDIIFKGGDPYEEIK